MLTPASGLQALTLNPSTEMSLTPAQQIGKPSLGTRATVAVNAILALSTGLLGTWVVTQPADTVQIAAGVSFLAVIALVVLGDTLRGRLDIANIKYVALLGFGLFLGLGMIADVFSPDYSFSGAAIILAFASLILFLAGFGLVSSPRATEIGRASCRERV